MFPKIIQKISKSLRSWSTPTTRATASRRPSGRTQGRWSGRCRSCCSRVGWWRHRGGMLGFSWKFPWKWHGNVMEHIGNIQDPWQNPGKWMDFMEMSWNICMHGFWLFFEFWDAFGCVNWCSHIRYFSKFAIFQDMFAIFFVFPYWFCLVWMQVKHVGLSQSKVPCSQCFFM